MKTTEFMLSIWGVGAIAFGILFFAWGCNPNDPDHIKAKAKYAKFKAEYEDVNSIKLVDINGDTVVVQAGATCHVYKKVK
jgi:hypothetical protein